MQCNLMERFYQVHTLCAGGAQSERLDASYDWLPAPPAHPQPLAGFGDGCSNPLPYDLAGKVQQAQSLSTYWLVFCNALHACVTMLCLTDLHLGIAAFLVFLSCTLKQEAQS